MKGVIGFVVGAVVGATVSYFVTSKIERTKASEQIEAVKSKMTELKEDNDILRDVRQKATANYNKPFEPLAKEKEEVTETANNGVNYNEISTNKVKKPQVVKEDQGIREVDEHSYFNYVSNKKFNEAAYTFYQGDGTLVDETSGMRVINPEKYVGEHGVDAMTDASVEEVFYVDEENKIVNCINISEDSYYDEDDSDEYESEE
jgi:uncharacterized membrane-anchored protein YhcB (DUF1043 family)